MARSDAAKKKQRALLPKRHHCKEEQGRNLNHTPTITRDLGKKRGEKGDFPTIPPPKIFSPKNLRLQAR